MPNIRPISDLRNHFSEITKEVQSDGKPVFLTKNGVGSIVVMSMEAYENGLYEREVYDKLMEAELQAISTSKRISHEDVMAQARNRIRAVEGKECVQD